MKHDESFSDESTRVFSLGYILIELKSSINIKCDPIEILIK